MTITQARIDALRKAAENARQDRNGDATSLHIRADELYALTTPSPLAKNYAEDLRLAAEYAVEQLATLNLHRAISERADLVAIHRARGALAVALVGGEDA